MIFNESDSYLYSENSDSDETANDLVLTDYSIETGIPIKTFKFKWILNHPHYLPLNMELYSPCICRLQSSTCRLKLVKYENGFDLFHVYETQHNDQKQNISNKMQVAFGNTSVNNPPNTLSCFENITSSEDSICQVIKYNISVLDKHGRERVKWAVSFPQKNDNECFSIGEYRSNSYSSKVLILHCCMKVIKTSMTEKQSLDTDDYLEEESLKKLSQDLKCMYRSSMGKDAILKVGTEEISVNNFLLYARSPVLKYLFYAKASENDTLVITNVSSSAMKRLVEFLYTGTFKEIAMDICFEGAKDLYIAANTYEVMDLRTMCGIMLMSKAFPDNAILLAKLAHQCRDVNLKLKVLNFIRLNFESIVNSETWRKFKKEETELANEILDLSLEVQC